MFVAPATATTALLRRVAAACALRRPARLRCSQLHSRAEQARPLDPPLVLTAPVVRGFERGSRQLGFPTANLSTEEKQVRDAVNALEAGVYYGFATFPGEAGGAGGERSASPEAQCYGTAINVGVVPTFGGNAERSFEAYLMGAFDEDFYGRVLRVAVLGFLRPEVKYGSLDELVANIRNDVRVAEELLRPLDPVAALEARRQHRQQQQR